MLFRYAKDIKTALLAADIIINQWGFTEYRLEVYGALDKSPSYTTNCQEIIASKGLRHQVTLEGEADPISVLERTVSATVIKTSHLPHSDLPCSGFFSTPLYQKACH